MITAETISKKKKLRTAKTLNMPSDPIHPFPDNAPPQTPQEKENARHLKQRVNAKCPRKEKETASAMIRQKLMLRHATNFVASPSNLHWLSRLRHRQRHPTQHAHPLHDPIRVRPWRQ